ncbi:MAG TPA: nucleoside deaminase [Pseudolabrys sp.]|nr:nucleoside deaminase [Pseudolabrys sp.]
MNETTNRPGGSHAAVDKTMMERCIRLSAKGIEQGEMPFAGLIARGGDVLVETPNQVAASGDATRHAELVAMSKAQGILGHKNLSDCTLYSMVEPCPMCAFAAREIRIGRVVFAIRSPVMGGLSKWNVLRDPSLSGALPEVFGPVPEVIAGLMQSEAEQVWQAWNPLIWALIKRRGYLGGEPDETASITLPALPERSGWLRRLFTFHNHSPNFFRKLRL